MVVAMAIIEVVMMADLEGDGTDGVSGGGDKDGSCGGDSRGW